jgi:hypothetical protein
MTIVTNVMLGLSGLLVVFNLVLLAGTVVWALRGLSERRRQFAPVRVRVSSQRFRGVPSP